MLGDAWLTLRGITQNARLGFTQAAKHKAFFDNVFSVFSLFLTSGYVPLFKDSVRLGYTTVTNSLTFVTIQLPCFILYYTMFYPDGKKVVPLTIYDLLTAIGIVYWIMCDGSRSNNGIHFNVYGFDLDSVDRLLHVLQVKFDLKCSIHKHKAGPRIYVHKQSMPHLRSLKTALYST